MKKLIGTIGYSLLNILVRLIGLSSLIAGIIIMTIPFMLVFLATGLDKANIMMSYVMRLPLNWTLGEHAGDLLLEIHRNIKE